MLSVPKAHALFKKRKPSRGVNVTKVYRLLITVIAVLIFAVAGCSKDDEASNNKDPQENEDRDIIVEEKEEPEVSFRYPLTGLPVEEAQEHRSIAVMVNNHPAARPQSGLHKADIVYEILAEGGVTRFLAIFHSEQPEIVGPVRSARTYYVQLANAYRSLYVHHGWSFDAEELITSGYIDSLNGLFYDGSLFKRASFRYAPHNSYITYENILKGAEQNNFDMTGAPESYSYLDEDGVVDGVEVGPLTIDYSNHDFQVRYEYDEASEKYKRYSADVLTTDYDTEETILLDNIFIVETAHQVIDDVGRRDIDLESGGKALLLQKGLLQEIEWKNVDGRIVPYSEGSEVPLVPGKTWINIVPALSQVTY